MKFASQKPQYTLVCIVLMSWAIDADTQIDLGPFLKAFVGPFLDSQRVTLMASSRRAALLKPKSTIDAAIEIKVRELKKFLQDNDKIDDELDDHDETTIIEFRPKIVKNDLRTERNISNSSKKNDSTPFTVDVEKYKRIKQKIDKILAKDTLTKNGKTIINNAFEDIVGKLLKNQCTWKSVVKRTKTRRSEDKSEEAAMRQWKSQFTNLKMKYFHVLKRTEAPVSIEDLIQIFQSFNDFFSQIMNDINGMSKRYEIKCKLIDKKKKLQYSPLNNKEQGFGKKHFRVQPIKDYTDGTCRNFRVCSSELSHFLKDFYLKVNETICSAFKNYAAMYDRDVNTDNSEEGTMVTDIINKTGDALEVKLQKLYKKKVEALKLDPKKDHQKNARIINDFMKKVVVSLNETVQKALGKDFARLSHKLKESVTRDVSISVAVDLANLQKRAAQKVCSTFAQCNGNSGRRSVGGELDQNLDENLVFVQLKVNLTDKTLARAAKDFLRSNRISAAGDDQTIAENTIDHKSNNDSTSFDHSKKHHQRHGTQAEVTITRTTLTVSGEKIRVTRMNYDSD